ncbi:congested-like trachea protein [Nematostella vectensis]|uniref:congested-like trachea protein n=1 Tax=Nematostella vectensis TaxID=45351 RepID=UPI002076F4F8|nr:congested-like trachea protein [Nematostella vectensis]XP_032229545.2 congested-like trachea protein [Nematostella vectensis]
MDRSSETIDQVNTRRLSPLRNLIAGSVGGVTGVTAGQPLDTIKVRLQASVGAGPLDMLARTVKSEGARGLYKGMLAPVLVAAPVTAVTFYSLSIGKRLQLSDPNKEPTLAQYYNAGVFCGVCVSFIYAPTERVKCLLQVQKESGTRARYQGLGDCLVQVYRTGGLRGVFKGLGPTMGREVIGGGFWYLTYEGLLRAMRSGDRTRDQVGPIAVMLSGGSAGLVFWMITYPIDAIKTRVQVAPEGTYARGARDALRELLRNEGPRALYRGYVPGLMRAVVVHAALLAGYELTMKTMNVVVP